MTGATITRRMRAVFSAGTTCIIVGIADMIIVVATDMTSTGIGIVGRTITGTQVMVMGTGIMVMAMATGEAMVIQAMDTATLAMDTVTLAMDTATLMLMPATPMRALEAIIRLLVGSTVLQ